MKKFFEGLASVIILTGIQFYILWAIFLAPVHLR